MSQPTIQLVGPNSGTQIPLAWDMPNTFWDSGLFWDAETYQSQKLVPIIDTAKGGIDIGVS